MNQGLSAVSFARLYQGARQGDLRARWRLLAVYHAALERQARRLMGLALRRWESPTGMVRGVLASAAAATLPTLFGDPRNHLGAWLTQMLRFRVLNLARRVRRRPETRLGAEPVAEDCEPLQHLCGAEDQGRLRAAVRRLKDNQQHALALRYGEGLGLAEVALRLGMTEAAANSLLARAREDLRRHLDDAKA